MVWLPCWMARRFARAAGSEWSAYLRSPMLIPFSCDDVLPPKQSAKHWFVCSFLQVPVWYINFSKADFILQWFECVTLQAGAEAALRLQRTAEECSNGAWQAREKCSKWVHCGLRVNNFLGGFDLALVHTAQTSKQLMKASLALNTLRIEWSASATGQLFKTLCQAKTLAGASIEDGLNTRHETDLCIDIRILKVSWFPGSSHERLLSHAVFGFSLCSSLSQTLDWYAGSSWWTIWQLWSAEARKSFELDRKWRCLAMFSWLDLCFGWFSCWSRHHRIVASGSKGRWLCWDWAVNRPSTSRWTNGQPWPWPRLLDMAGQRSQIICVYICDRRKFK